jgi:hypothetical protein
MKRVHIDRPRARREPWRCEDLPPGPLDPDVVQAKALARALQTRQELTGRTTRAHSQRKRAS